MPTIIQPRRWSMKPPPGARLNYGHPSASGLYAYWPLNEFGGLTIRDIARNNNGTLSGTTWSASQYGSAVNAAGSPAFGSIALDLSDTAIVTLAFWMKWTTFANDDALFGEFTANQNTQNGAFIMDPNSGSGPNTGQFSFGSAKFSGSATYWNDSFARPSAGAWHHYVLVINRTTPVNVAYVDGVVQSLTLGTHSASAMGNFANDTLYLFSRGGASLFGAGGLAQLGIWKRALSATEAQTLYADPYCMIEPQGGQRRPWSAGPSFNPAWATGCNRLIGSGLYVS